MHARRSRMLATVLGATLLVTVTAPAAVLAGAQPAASRDLATADAAIGTELAVQYTRFYPRKDDYRDTNLISGTTLGPATVTIRIYNSGGTRIKSFLLGAQEGAYSVVWNGRKKNNTLFPQGTYTVKQFLSAAGTTETTVHTVVLSHKKVYWRLGSQTRYADTGAFFTAGNGAVFQQTNPVHGIHLVGSAGDGSYAAGRYVFTLPSAHVYASLRVSIYGRGGSLDGDGHERVGTGYVGIWNFETAELDGTRHLDFETDWYRSSVPAGDHVTSDRKVQTWARADHGESVAHTKMQLTYKYGNLDY